MENLLTIFLKGIVKKQRKIWKKTMGTFLR